jgi:hypothetical protein
MTTIVTAFFDIGRDKKGDGRSIEEYLQWIKKTLHLNCNLFIVTEEKFKTFFEKNRPELYRSKTVIKIIDFKDCHYYRYYDKMKEILESTDYCNRIKHPDRVECKMPEYNIIQYSKFHFLNMAIEENPFQTEYFLWADAGISRFFLDVDISLEYPSKKSQQILQENYNRFIIQKRNDLYTYPLDDEFVWDSANLFIGTMFGGSKIIVTKITELIEQVFIEKMLNKNNVNNEQLSLALVWNDYKELFFLVDNYTQHHLWLFKYLS